MLTLKYKALTHTVTKWLLLCGLLAPFLLVAFLIVALLLTPGHDYISETISQLGARDRPHPEVVNAGFVISGLLILGFAIGIYLNLGRSMAARIVGILIAINGVGIILTGAFQADSNALGTSSTLEGNLHHIFAAIAYSTLLMGITVFAMLVHRKPGWRGFTQFSLAVAIINLGLLLLYAMGVSKTIEGSLQLSFFGMSLAWVVAVSLQSLRANSAYTMNEFNPS